MHKYQWAGWCQRDKTALPHHLEPPFPKFYHFHQLQWNRYMQQQMVAVKRESQSHERRILNISEIQTCNIHWQALIEFWPAPPAMYWTG
jgi:hypothetical protein